MTKGSNKTQTNSAFHAPLHPLDTVERTFGCRHTNSIICSRNSMPDVCAFVREDGICLAPPRSWPKQFVKLQEKQKKA